MNIHKNARTTLRIRGEIVQRVLPHQDASAGVAAAVGVSERRGRKLVARSTAEVEAGSTDRLCRPRRPCSSVSRRRCCVARVWGTRSSRPGPGAALSVGPAGDLLHLGVEKMGV